ncbi:(Fe-S)-binding protein [Marinilabilia rubra]|uniref:Fe-S oxidoreductase n=1 Tax=Marinilabilia rubra TaxID=2162893 RepID=A0A2U2B489_9BACT|nr:(Fe-S)-binding protein [Marinilabilia rubra]PWD97891.1 Fe-S oxidoreductase [Marinilabilia rubra]
MQVDLFIPCFIDQLFPQTGWNVVKVLEKGGIEVNYNPKQTCCGQPTFNSGYWNPSRKIAQKFLKDFPNDRPIVVPSASCAGYIKNHYPQLFKDQPELKEDVDRVCRNVIELTDFLVNHLRIEDFGACFPHKITYHDGCAALREYGLKDEPGKLLRNVAGIDLRELPENTTCCGFGGTFMVKFVPISTAMVEQKVENALSTGAEYIVSTEASCLINIESYIRKNELPIKTLHIADVLANF